MKKQKGSNIITIPHQRLSWCGVKDIKNSIEAVRALGTTDVVSLAGKPMRLEGITYHRLHISDKRDVSAAAARAHFQKTTQLLQSLLANPKAHVIVHCMAGMSRSPTALLAYLVFGKRMQFETAHKTLTALRPGIRVNPMFLEALSNSTCEREEEKEELKEER